MSSFVNAVANLAKFEGRKLQQEINRLQRQKFSSLSELHERDAVVAQKTAQLDRVKLAQVVPKGVLQIFECPVCFIRTAEHAHTKVVLHESGSKADTDLNKCGRCGTVIESDP